MIQNTKIVMNFKKIIMLQQLSLIISIQKIWIKNITMLGQKNNFEFEKILILMKVMFSLKV